MRRVLITLAVLITLIAIFYTEEDWRGKRAWENCKRELEAKGAVLDWSAYIPPAVPDDQNFFKAPKMEEWFEGRGMRDLSKRLENPKTVPVGEKDKIKTEADARDYLKWSDQFTPDFNLIRKALKRPYARMVGDYTQPYAVPIPNFLTTRVVAQVLAQRAHCYMLLNQPEQALSELTLMHNMCRLLEGAPTGKPMTLVAAMINVAVTGLYVDAIAEGFQRRIWRKPQLAELQEQLGKVNLSPFVVEAFRDELVATTYTLEKTPPAVVADQFINESGGKPNLWRRLKDPFYTFLVFAPRGWVYQNMVIHAQLHENMLDSYNLTNDLISPSKVNQAIDEIHALGKWSPYAFLEKSILPNFIRVTQSLAYDQTRVSEAQIGCALERYWLTHGEYPETLDALAPQFIEKIPHDIIGGQPSQGSGLASQPLHYHRTADGKFMLYSVGWNETDDGGEPGTLSDPNQGDWVWKN